MAASSDPGLETLAVEVDGAVGRLWLNRPEKLNPLSTQTLKELAVAARWFDDRPEVKVVVIGGRGRAFCAGADLGPPVDDLVSSARDSAAAGGAMADAIAGMRAITIARLHGHCVGGGVVLTTACDLRVAAEDTRFSIPEVDLGIPLTWGGIPRLIRDIGPVMTQELVLTCRPFDAAEAKAIGLVNRVVAPDQLDDAVETLAAELAAKSALTLQATKRHVTAIADIMVGTARTWNDADTLVVAQRDPESLTAAAAYITRLREEARAEELGTTRLVVDLVVGEVGVFDPVELTADLLGGAA